MTYRHQRAIDLSSNHAIDQEDSGTVRATREENRFVQAESAAMSAGEVKAIFSASEWAMDTSDEFEDLLSVWEALPDDAFLIY